MSSPFFREGLIRTILIAGLVAWTSARVLAAETALEMYQKAKQQVRAGACSDALKTLDALDAENAKPGHDQDRKSAVAPVAFYRGVCEATLGKKTEAKTHFTAFLGLVPNGTVDPAIYSKEAVSVFEETKKAHLQSRPGEAAAAAAQTIPSAYAKFVMTAQPPPEERARVGRTVRSGPS